MVTMSIYDELDELVLKVTRLSRRLICESEDLETGEYERLKLEIKNIKEEINTLRIEVEKQK